MTMLEFLKARLAEDEAAAKAATSGPWRVVNVTDHRSATVDGPDAVQDGGYDDATKARKQVMRPMAVIPPDVDYGPTVELVDAEHIARHDPARVLREVEAKRALMGGHERHETDSGTAYCDCQAECGPIYDALWPCKPLRWLALPYADDPDYDETWRP